MLEIQKLRVVYPNGFEALRSVGLSVRDGEVVALIGRSGAGKSTLLRCINGLQQPASGSVRLDGRELVGLADAQMIDVRRRIGFIWQEYNVVGRLSVMKNVLTGRLGHGDRRRSLLHYFDRSHREVALRSLERVNLLHRAMQRADRLSGGEKQRVAIARVILKAAPILLFDEATSALDTHTEKEIQANLKEVSTGRTTLVIAHRLSTVIDADQILVLDEGQVIERGSHEELLRRGGAYAAAWTKQQKSAQKADVVEEDAFASANARD